MQIHRVNAGESLYSIAREYGISPTKLKETNNLLYPDSLAPGRELLILIPTKTYTARREDTLPAIARRFAVSEAEIYKNNPSLLGTDKIYPEEILALKYPKKSHGIALLNGFVYKDFSKERLSMLMPYLSFVTVSSAVYEGGRLRSLFDNGYALKKAKESKKSAILRVYAKNDEAYESDKFISLVTRAAAREGFDGISIPHRESGESEAGERFLFDLKRALISEGLSLQIETDGNISEKCSEMADSLAICLDDTQGGASDLYERYAKEKNAINSFIDLSPFAYVGKKAYPIDEVYSALDKIGAPLTLSDDGRIICGELRGEEVVIPSLENIKAKLDLIGELGYLGCCIDVMRCPISHLMMLSSLFHLSPDYL